MKHFRIVVALTALTAVVLVIAGCNMFGGSPTATFKAYYEAAKKKDAAGMKKALSKKSVEMMETQAKNMNKSFDDMLKEDNFSKDAPDKVPETRNEKIDGDKATLEIKNDKGDDWLTMPFVKEDGEWKMAFDVLVEDLKNKIKIPTSNP